MPCALTVRSDRRLLRRLLQNFVSNAIKYTPSGRVLIGCRRRGGRLRIDVYDTGIGIPQAKRRAVFKEFHRLDQGARVARGVGLGLSIVERIARVLGCEVAVQSAVGRGSRFSVEVPRGKAAAAAAAPARVPRASIPAGSPARSALCIDNDRAILDGMEKLLGGWGCRVLTAADLAQALAALSASGVAAGRAAGRLSSRRRQRHRRHRRAARRALCGHARCARDPDHRRPSRHVREEAQAGGVHLLNKPIKPAALRALMMQWRVQRVAAE